MSSNPERELILRARDGDPGAFRALVERYTPRIYALARNLVKSAMEAEDVVQDVFFKVHRKLGTFQENSAFYTWLYRVTVNTAADHLKKRRHDRALQMDDLGQLPLEDPSDSPMEGMARRDLRHEVRAAMAELPEKFRTILVLRELEELTYEEISEVLGCSKGTVESRLFRARARLKDRIERAFRS